ncbi:MAG: SMP-30/gluconolactonase/LRE family protein [Aeromicrobium sp.]
MSRPSIDPARWTPPAPAPTSAPTELTGLRVVETSGHGTEDVLVRADGSVLTGVDDGRILAVDPTTGLETQVADTEGRPLGIEHHPHGGYVVCDAHRGLLHLHDDGTIEVLVEAVDGELMLFCNNAAVAGDGTIYFTDSSTSFSIEHWKADLIEHRTTGRLFRRDPDGTVALLADGLAFANGVALAADESFVVVAETGGYCLRRLWLTGERAGTLESFGPTLPGFPDNISTGDDGTIWVTVASPRDTALDALLPRAPWIRKIVWALPDRLQPQPQSVIRVQSYGPDGTLVRDVAGRHDGFGTPTGVRQVGRQVWMGSLEQTSIAVFDLP